MTEKTSSRNMVDILLLNGVDFKSIKEDISSMLENARQTDDFEKNYDLYRVVIPLYKASIALESVAKNPSLVDDTLLASHIANVIQAEAIFERMLDRVTDRAVGAKILGLLSQIIPVGLLNELGGHVTDDDLGIIPESETESKLQDKTKWNGR